MKRRLFWLSLILFACSMLVIWRVNDSLARTRNRLNALGIVAANPPAKRLYSSSILHDGYHIYETLPQTLIGDAVDEKNLRVLYPGSVESSYECNRLARLFERAGLTINWQDWRIHAKYAPDLHVHYYVVKAGTKVYILLERR